MAAGNTYEAIAATTLGSDTATVTLSSIPSTYTDLVVVVTGNMNGNGEPYLRFNSDTSTNYSWIELTGYVSGVYNGAAINVSTGIFGGHLGYWPNSSTNIATAVIHINNYSNTSTYKTYLSKDAQGNSETGAYVGTWRSTSAINSISFSATNSTPYRTGTTFNLYGIKAA